MNSREMFEAWMQKEHPSMLECSRWHEDEQRYTVMSTTQLLWTTWKACYAQQAARIAELEAGRDRALALFADVSEQLATLRQRIADAPILAVFPGASYVLDRPGTYRLIDMEDLQK